MTNKTMAVDMPVHFLKDRRGRKRLVSGPAPVPAPPRLPRVTRLMALAHRFDGLLQQGVVADYADLARLGHVTRARMSQLMNLLLLAPPIQETLLFLPPVLAGRDPLKLADLQPIALTPEWSKQLRMWQRLCTERGISTTSEEPATS